MFTDVALDPSTVNRDLWLVVVCSVGRISVSPINGGRGVLAEELVD